MINHSVWIDSHCHLEMLKGDLESALRKSFEQGMDFCVTVGTDSDSNRKIVDLCDNYKKVYGTLGIHPHNASRFKSAHLDWIKEEVRKNSKIVAMGECGLDFFYNHSKKEDQKKAFIAQLSAAKEVGMPVVIHSREAEKETNEIIKEFKGNHPPGVFHCFTSPIEQAKIVLDAGFYLSFNGICTFPQAESVREVLTFTPRDRMLLETDAPFLSPIPYRGKENIPGHVTLVGEYIARFLKISPKKLADQIRENTLTLFPRLRNEN